MKDYLLATLAAGVVITLAAQWFLAHGPALPISEEAATADPEGAARPGEVAGVPTGLTGRTVEGRPGPATRERDQLVVVEAPPRTSRRVAAPGSLLFVIRDPWDSPISGVRVAVGSGRRQRSDVTGSDGEAAFTRLAAGRYGYRVEAPERPVLAAVGSLQLAAGQTEVLELRLGAFDQVIAGRVVDRDGAPVGGLAVRARLYRPPTDASVLVPQSQSEQQAETAADGSFEIGGLMAGEYEVRTIADDLYAAAEAIVRAGSDTAVLTVVERRELTVFGQVTSTAGEPLTDVRVVGLGQPSRRTRTDGEGWYELLLAVREEQVPRFRFDLEGYEPQRVALDPVALGGADDRRLDAILRPVGDTVDVAVRLVDEQGAPVPGERVYLRSAGLTTHYQAVSGADGAAWFPEVAASADYRVHVRPRGPYTDYSGEAALGAATELEIVLEALAVGTLAGHMIDAAGEPVPGFGLRLYSADARGKWRQVSGDLGGYFEVEAPAGPLILRTASLPQFQITGVSLDAGADAYVELVLDWGEAVLEGRVVDASGNPLPDAEVDLHWAHGDGSVHSRATRRTVTDREGAFMFSRLGPAPHRLEARAPGHVTHRQILQPGTEWVEVRLEPGEK